MKKQTISFDKSPWKGFALIGLVSTVLLVACGDDGSASGSDDVVKINDKTISGVSQKGPFVKGSSVTVYELGAQSLSQTGKSYDGKIKNERGEFIVEVEKLESPYALLKADGYYRNEITGAKSNGTVTLYAMTDLTNRSEVNVNLLTHLEYERSRYLVKNEKLSVAEAKMQAEKEVLESFGIEGDFENSESLNIFGDDAGSSALLAISVLMQGNLKEADFTERLTDYAADIEEDGKWDDEKSAAKIADWAAEKSLNGGLAVIRNNIIGWELSANVPAFEKYVNNYWWNIYALEGCNKDREGEVKAAENSLSGNNGVHFICTDGAWKIATDIEKDTYKWKPGKDGDVKNGDVVKTNCYVYEESFWRNGEASDCSLELRGCIKSRQDTVGLGMDKNWYICDNQKWRKATNIEKDTATWGVGEFDGEVRVGQVNKNIYYIYDADKMIWRNATMIEKDTYDYKGNKRWADGKDGEIKKGTLSDTIYVFDTTTWRVADNIEKVLGGCAASIQDSVGKAGRLYYICKTRRWTEAKEIQYDTYKQECSEFGRIVHGNVNTDYVYFCYGNEWKRFYGNESIAYGKLVDERDGQIYRTVQIGEQIWMAENLSYSNEQEYFSMINRNACLMNDCVKYGRIYTWSATIDSIYWDRQGKKCGLEGYGCDFFDNVQGICPEGWHVPNNDEWTALYFSGKNGYKELRAKGFDEWGDATDEYGFSALPARYNKSLGFPSVVDSAAFFWSATSMSSGDWPCYLQVAQRVALIDNMGQTEVYAKDLLSVRCVKD